MKLENYLKAHNQLSEFMKAITQKNCSPCQHNRGIAGCCIGGPYLFSKIEKELNKDVIPSNEDPSYCAYLELGKGCTLKHKCGTCLSYLCGAILRNLSNDEREMYWKLRENLAEAIFLLEGIE